MLVLMAGLGGTAPVASADDDLSILGGSPSTVSAVPDGATAGEGTIECSIKTDNPHGSGHVGGTINVESHVTCSGANNGNVASLTAQTQLWRITPPPERMRLGKQKSNQNMNNIETYADTPCIAQSYQYYGIGIANVVFPPGYKPPTARIGHQGPTVSVLCGS
ncbi:hypothetical protein [Mycobacterium sp. 050134]|uniref:hypothetical protein n=1 Tax=Mycobacterium sp. 050134 TaxID=3096111 RepID=UPI002EDA34A5